MLVHRQDQQLQPRLRRLERRLVKYCSLFPINASFKIESGK